MSAVAATRYRGGMKSFCCHAPLVFTPILRPQVWGGRRLAALHKRLPPAGLFGESWEISPLNAAESRVADGAFAGQTLSAVWTAGLARQTGHPACCSFPWLVKWLDIDDWLSVQVHPNAEQSLRWLGHECPKAEAWVVVHAEPSARVYAGFHTGITAADVSRAIHHGRLQECLHTIVPRAGDCFSLPAGVVHAAGGGLLLAEIQQPSDATFRLYDWDRTGPDGQRRPLHVREAMDCIAWPARPIQPTLPQPLATPSAAAAGERLLSTPPFEIDRFRVRDIWADDTERLAVWMVLEGAVNLEWAEGSREQTANSRALPRGATVLVPAGIGPVRWQPHDASATLLRVRLPAA